MSTYTTSQITSQLHAMCRHEIREIHEYLDSMTDERYGMNPEQHEQLMKEYEIESKPYRDKIALLAQCVDWLKAETLKARARDE